MIHESLSININPDGETQELIIPVNHGKPKGIAPIINRQISLSGREIEIHCSESDQPEYRIDPYHFEEARELTAVERRRFVRGVMHELEQTGATSIVIRNSNE